MSSIVFLSEMKIAKLKKSRELSLLVAGAQRELVHVLSTDFVSAKTVVDWYQRDLLKVSSVNSLCTFWQTHRTLSHPGILASFCVKMLDF